MVMHGSCVFVQESAKAVEPGWLDGGQAPPATGGGVRTYVRSYVRLSLTSSVWKSTWSTLKVDTYCLQLAIKALAYLESIHCRVYRLLFPQRVCRGAVAYSSVHTCLLCQSLFSPLALASAFACFMLAKMREFCVLRLTSRCACLSALHYVNFWGESNPIVFTCHSFSYILYICV